jgi:hypothetical protein
LNVLISNLETHLQASVCQSQKGKSQSGVVALSPAVGSKVLLPEWHPVRIPRLRHSRLWTIPERPKARDTQDTPTEGAFSAKLSKVWETYRLEKDV